MNLAIFDIDGTLLDNLMSEDECYSRALEDRLALRSLDTNWAAYRHVSDGGIAAEAYQREFARAPSEADLEAAITQFVEYLRTVHSSAGPLTPMPGAPELLRELPERGWAVALATGAWRRAAEFKLSSAGMPVEGIPLATSEDGPARPDIIAKAMRDARRSHGVVAFERVVSIGDGVWDVEAARVLGLPFVGVGASERTERLRLAGATCTIADFVDIERTMEALNTATAPRNPLSA